MIINERLAFNSDFTLEELIKLLRMSLSLDEFQFDYENENNWGWTYDENRIEINVSKPYEEDKLYEWDSTVPKGCNFGVALMSNDSNFNFDPHKYNHDFVINKLIPKYICVIEQITKTKVYYHRGNHHK
ncbi:hypothetical protein [Paenibacillus sp. FSL H7-0331]|uniref:hypothetical protein n=1 Tax=Paenibacillus sp. FSL H7-0331 TaxID=1920421 RepID=UPI00096C126F|nr:hypothetical protein [Paenibacillus sp. FSL H7-0331]OME93346.1 hypothetical protein BK127_41780 [Paenibacillus sp. FSL H7-0331]